MAPSEVSAVSLKIPPYWVADPSLWFYQVETQFSLGNISVSRTKCDHVIAHLPMDVISEVRDVLPQLTGTTDPYGTLKEAILRRTSISQRARLQQLLSTEELGDRRPSQLLRHMLQLIGPHTAQFDNDLLIELFLQRMPGHIQQVLTVVREGSSIDKLAETADKLIEIQQPTINAASCNSSLENTISELQNQIHSLTTKINALSTRGRSPYKRRSSSHRFNSKQRINPSSKLCWYHQTYGSKAHRCVKPCSYSENTPSES